MSNGDSDWRPLYFDVATARLLSSLTHQIMGLDMYAARRLNVKNWSHQRSDEQYAVQIARGGKPVPGIQSERLSKIEEEVMYWRKANHIHAWFVDNVQGHKDDCGSYHVDWDALRRLLGVCNTVINNSKLVDGMVWNGVVYDKKHPNGRVMREPGKVLKDATAAETLLPTRDGFFFGNVEYDEDYLINVKDTHDWCARMLQDYADGVPGDIYYSSSW